MKQSINKIYDVNRLKGISGHRLIEMIRNDFIEKAQINGMDYSLNSRFIMSEDIFRLIEQSAHELLKFYNASFLGHDYIIDTNLYPGTIKFEYNVEPEYTASFHWPIKSLEIVHKLDINPPEIEKVLFNKPYTIVFWKDGTKTIVKAQNKERYDKEKGLAMAMIKKIYGTNKNKSNYYDVIKEWIK